MGKELTFTETIFTTIETKRAFRAAEECLVEIRLVESRKEDTWIYEYEVRGGTGKVAKFIGRIKDLESKFTRS